MSTTDDTTGIAARIVRPNRSGVDHDFNMAAAQIDWSVADFFKIILSFFLNVDNFDLLRGDRRYGENDQKGYKPWEMDSSLSGDFQAAGNGRIASGTDVKPATSGLIQLIGDIEAKGGNFNIWNGGTVLDLTNMTVAEVREQQKNWRDIPNATSSAAGFFQIVGGTMEGLIKRGVVAPDDYFTPENQIKMGIELMRMRGLDKYLRGEINTTEFQANLANEWAAIPKDSSGISAHAGTGNNEATDDYTPNQIVAILEDMRTHYQSSSETEVAALSEQDSQSDFGKNAAEVTGTGSKQVAEATPAATPGATGPEQPTAAG